MAKKIDKESAQAAALGELMGSANIADETPAISVPAAKEKPKAAAKERNHQLAVIVSDDLYRRLKTTSHLASITDGYKNVSSMNKLIVRAVEEYFDNHRVELENDLGLKMGA